jgi:hypothetical protein
MTLNKVLLALALGLALSAGSYAEPATPSVGATHAAPTFLTAGATVDIQLLRADKHGRPTLVSSGTLVTPPLTREVPTVQIPMSIQRETSYVRGQWQDAAGETHLIAGTVKEGVSFQVQETLDAPAVLTLELTATIPPQALDQAGGRQGSSVGGWSKQVTVVLEAGTQQQRFVANGQRYTLKVDYRLNP